MLLRLPNEEAITRFLNECEQEAFDTGNSDEFRLGLDLGVKAALHWLRNNYVITPQGRSVEGE